MYWNIIANRAILDGRRNAINGIFIGWSYLTSVITLYISLKRVVRSEDHACAKNLLSIINNMTVKAIL